MLKIYFNKEKNIKTVFLDNELECIVNMVDFNNEESEEGKILNRIINIYDYLNDHNLSEYNEILLRNGIQFEALNEKSFYDLYLKDLLLNMNECEAASKFKVYLNKNAYL